jgi:hypothetical protein
MRKKIYLFLILLVIIIISVLTVFFVFYNNKFENQINNIEFQEKTKDQEGAIVQEKKVIIDSDNKIYNEAISIESDYMCNAIEDEKNKDFCFKKIAYIKKDINICENIKNEKIKINCQDNIYQEIALMKTSLINCLNIINKNKRVKCFNEIIKDNTDILICDSIKNYENEDLEKNNFNYCLDKVNFNNAFYNSDMSSCESINDSELKAVCMSVILKINLNSDSDGDGLNFLNEISYKTDPSNSDTDGDGYFDGDELKNNYNPNGEGNIENLYFNLE